MSRMTRRSVCAAVRLGSELAPAMRETRVAGMANSITAKTVVFVLVFVLVGFWAMVFVSQRAEFVFRAFRRLTIMIR
jgi:hypothetical protein